MKLPLFLQRQQSGDLTFIFNGRMWFCRDVNGHTYFCFEHEEEIPHISWLIASAQLFLEKREADNLKIRNARHLAIGAFIFADIMAGLYSLVWLL